jgi:hypothetical protein
MRYVRPIYSDCTFVFLAFLSETGWLLLLSLSPAFPSARPRPRRHRDGVGEGFIRAAVAAEILLADLVTAALVSGFVDVEYAVAIGLADVEFQRLAGIKAANTVLKSQVAADRDGVDHMRAEIGHRYEVVDRVPWRGQKAIAAVDQFDSGGR